MEECELCGRTTKDVYVLNVENVELRACASCAKGKKVVRTELEAKVQKQRPSFQKPKIIKDEDRQLVENYSSVIRNAREGMKIPLNVFAEMINEKEHFLLRIEEGRTMPTIALTKKLEKALKIKLTEEPKEQEKKISPGKSQSATLGDFVK